MPRRRRSNGSLNTALLKTGVSFLEVKSVGVIGAGVMGSGIALLFLQNGFKVTLVDHDPENLHKAATYIDYSLDSLVAKSRLDKKKRAGMILKLSTPTIGNHINSNGATYCLQEVARLLVRLICIKKPMDCAHTLVISFDSDLTGEE